jgi:hypothetical protein
MSRVERQRARSSGVESGVLRAALLAAWVASAAGAGAASAADLVLSTGGFNVGTHRQTFEAGFEVRLKPRALPGPRRWDLELIPVLGATYTSEDATYGYLGGRVEVWLAPRWLLTPSFAAGAYSVGRDTNLGHDVEFRSALELAYRLGDGARLGVAFYHLSNAGLGRLNPGSESLVLTYSFWPRWRLP